MPFDFAVPQHVKLLWEGSFLDAVANIAMFVPLGCLYRLTHDRGDDRWGIRPLLAGLALGAMLEAAQLFLAARFSSPLDVVTNGAGAWFGALAHDAIARRLHVTHALVAGLALELPLMGVIYLLIPLLWLNGLATGKDSGRMALSVLLGLIGAGVLGTIHRNRTALAGGISTTRFGSLAAAWYLVGAIPNLMFRPLIVLEAAVVVGAATVVWARMGAGEAPAGERRFEAEALRRLIPVMLLYLVGLGGWPPWASATAWHGTVGMRDVWGAAHTQLILRSLEHLAAFTVLGYIIAESRGRRELRFVDSVGTILATGALVAAGLELLAGVRPGGGASALRGILATAAALHGAGIYHLQRSHIRWLRQTESAVPPPSGGATLWRLPQSERSEPPTWAGRTG